MSTPHPPAKVAPTTLPAHAQSAQPRRHTFLRRLSIGSKLNMGFGVLVVLTLLVVGLNYITSLSAITTMNSTIDVRVPVSLASSRAQTDLLRMFGDVRGYLALGDPQFVSSYEASEQTFRSDLELLEQLSQGEGFEEENKARLKELLDSFQTWRDLPHKLFLLRDDQMEREPAYAWLNTTGSELGGTILININEIIQIQAGRTPTYDNNALFETMAQFQSSYAAMFSGLRGYVTTLNPNFRYYEYMTNLRINDEAWESLLKQRETMTPRQQTLLDEIGQARQRFLQEIPTEVFTVMQSDHWREDMYVFRTEAAPLTDKMHVLLREITDTQQKAMLRDLRWGSQALVTAQWQTVIGGGFAVFLGLLLAFIIRQNIAGPVQRLTDAAELIRGGRLDALAPVESGDEIGVFAETFNQMTTQLRETMTQIRNEKKRADDLLNIVIPIGVALSSERDFNRMLGNMLVEAMTFCRADGGAIFLREEKQLRMVMVLNRSQSITIGGASGMPVPFQHLSLNNEETESSNERDNVIAHTVHSGTTVNIESTYQNEQFSFAGIRDFDEQFNYRTISLLAIPLKNNRNEVLGVLELSNAQNPETGAVIPFDTNLQQMMESFSSLAVAALESYIREQNLRMEIQQLRIEIDESKRQQQVSEIVDTDFFQDLRAKARNLRNRSKQETTET